ncbi:class I SAM-dependent methyltransferase [Polycladomyces subterraneus]|uniref:Class I SAM-dependent methyltransferase n=1 Tax=Polycladomyces subterraneus TaxID=1016997 RepID=A0ABT8IJI9_9BACL|nr:class I SAM-dependent methyltransferase [Polycladomyces subterraneus]MDN4592959.1 class I SAM-dependent methyltransferase [Polycladomyces subterraneus]
MTEMEVDFGKTSQDYVNYRAGYPEALFLRLKTYGIGQAGQTILDIGTGTGYLARPLAKQGAKVTGMDPSAQMLAAAAQLDREQNITISYVQGRAENLPFPAHFFHVVTAGQCWHWFDRDQAAREVYRVLQPEGKVAIVHFDWLPLPGNVVSVTEQLILRYNPKWKGGGGTGIYPQWLTDLSKSGFQDIESFSFDVNVRYTHESWRGRIRASAGVGASLPPELVDAFDAELQKILTASYPDPLMIPHRVFAVIGTKKV